jgi:orotate phosphoribosyltransferase
MLRTKILQCKAVLSKYEYDAIAVRGISGLMLGPTLSVLCDKSLIVVRKHDEDRHSTNVCEGDRGAKRYIIVDDFISDGDTVRAIYKDIKEWQERSHGPENVAVCLGVLCATHIPYAFTLDQCKRKIELDVMTVGPKGSSEERW